MNNYGYYCNICLLYTSLFVCGKRVYLFLVCSQEILVVVFLQMPMLYCKKYLTLKSSTPLSLTRARAFMQHLFTDIACAHFFVYSCKPFLFYLGILLSMKDTFVTIASNQQTFLLSLPSLFHSHRIYGVQHSCYVGEKMMLKILVWINHMSQFFTLFFKLGVQESIIFILSL